MFLDHALALPGGRQHTEYCYFIQYSSNAKSAMQRQANLTMGQESGTSAHTSTEAPRRLPRGGVWWS